MELIFKKEKIMWQKLTKDEILQEVYRRGYKYGREYRVCSQCTLLTVLEVFGIQADELVKAVTGFAGGIGRTGETCGAYCAGVMALGLFYGRDIQTMKHPKPEDGPIPGHEIEKGLGRLIKNLRARFIEEYGSVLCNDIEKKVIGRSFDKWDPKDRIEKDRLGGHTTKCPMVIGKATQWISELIVDEERGKK